MKKHKSNIFEAIEFANQIHQGQFRKSTSIPKIVHLIGVMNILLESNYTEEMVIAALLHDSLEDTNITAEDLRKRFGAKIAKLVEDCSEKDKSLSWEDRKKETIKGLKRIPLKAAIIVCADKLDNFRFIRREYETIGDKVWERFNRGKKHQEWYFKSIIMVLKKRLVKNPGKSMLIELEKEVNMVFSN